MNAIQQLKIELQRRLADRQKHQLAMLSFKEEIENLIEWLFKFLDEIK